MAAVVCGLAVVYRERRSFSDAIRMGVIYAITL